VLSTTTTTTPIYFSVPIWVRGVTKNIIQLKWCDCNISIWHWYTYRGSWCEESDSYWCASMYIKEDFFQETAWTKWVGNNAMSLLFYNSCYFMVIRLFSLLYNHVQQQISNVYFLRLVVDQNISHIALLLMMVLSPFPFFFSIIYWTARATFLFELSICGHPSRNLCSTIMVWKLAKNSK